jgi:hypothetical protein
MSLRAKFYGLDAWLQTVIPGHGKERRVFKVPRSPRRPFITGGISKMIPAAGAAP